MFICHFNRLPLIMGKESATRVPSFLLRFKKEGTEPLKPPQNSNPPSPLPQNQRNFNFCKATESLKKFSNASFDRALGYASHRISLRVKHAPRARSCLSFKLNFMYQLLYIKKTYKC